MSCYVCGSAGKSIAAFEPSVTSESKLLRLRSTLLACPGCGLVHTETALDFARYYSDEYEAKLSDDGADEIVSTADGQIVFRTDVDYQVMMRAINGLVTTGSALFEYGCGRARILSRLHKSGFTNLSAFDLSEQYRATAASFCGERIFIGERPSLTCDLAYSFFVLEHDTDPVRSLLYLHRVIRPGGHLFLMLPNYLTNVIDLACADHVNHFSPRYLRELLSTCGFEPVSIDDGSSIGAVVALARREKGPTPDKPAFARPDLAEYAVDSTRPFIAYLADVREAIERVDRKRPLYLYGAGFYATLVHSQLNAVGIGIAGLFDANPRKTGTTFLGHRVNAADSIEPGKYDDSALFVCVNPRISGSIAEKHGSKFAEVHCITRTD